MEASAMLLTKRIPRSRIDLITLSLQTKIVKKQETQKVQFDKGSREKEFKPQEKCGYKTIMEKRNGYQE